MPRRPAKSPKQKSARWWQPTLTNRKADWREYLLWQIGLLITALSILYVVLLGNGLPVSDPTVVDWAILISLTVDLVVSLILWYLIAKSWSRSKRFALGFMILADVFAKLLFLQAANAGIPPFDSWWYLLLVIGTALYLLGTGVIGIIVWRRGDDVSPWWK